MKTSSLIRHRAAKYLRRKSRVSMGERSLMKSDYLSYRQAKNYVRKYYGDFRAESWLAAVKACRPRITNRRTYLFHPYVLDIWATRYPRIDLGTFQDKSNT